MDFETDHQRLGECGLLIAAQERMLVLREGF
jgi:hypothetical protein